MHWLEVKRMCRVIKTRRWMIAFLNLVVLDFFLGPTVEAAIDLPVVSEYSICVRSAPSGPSRLGTGKRIRVRGECRTPREVEWADVPVLCARSDSRGVPREGALIRAKAECSKFREVAVGEDALVAPAGGGRALSQDISHDPLKVCALEDPREEGEARPGRGLRVRKSCLFNEIEWVDSSQLCVPVKISRRAEAKVFGSPKVRASCRPGLELSIGSKVIQPRNDRPPGAVNRLSILSSPESSLHWLGSTRFDLRLHDPWSAAGVLRDRPVGWAGEERLEDWVRDWARRGLDAKPPIAAISLESPESGLSRSTLIAEVSDPYLEGPDTLVVRLDLLDTANLSQSIFDSPEFGLTRLYLDQPDEVPATKFFLLEAPTGQLVRKGRLNRYRLSLNPLPDVLAFSQGPFRDAVIESPQEWIDLWSRRGFDVAPPKVGLVFRRPDHPSDMEWGLVELSSPRLGRAGSLDFDVRLLWKPDGRLALFTENGELERRTALDSPVLFFDSVQAISEARLPSACGADLDCLEGQVCDATGLCIQDQICSPSIDCGLGQACDPDELVCRWKPCESSSDCEWPLEVCDQNLCVAQSLVGSQEQVVGPGQWVGVWGASDSPANTRTSCSAAPVRETCSPANICPAGQTCSAGYCFRACGNSSGCKSRELCNAGRCVSSGEALCLAFEEDFANRAGYLAQTLSEARGEAFDFYGQLITQIVDESPLMRQQEDDPLRFPSWSIREKIFAPFSMFSTPWLNAITRIGQPLFGRSGLEPYSSEAFPQGPEAAYTFISPFFENLKSQPPFNFPEAYLVSGRGSQPLLLNRQFGAGGGYGCYVGVFDPNSQKASAPMLQFGGGFGHGLSEADGLDVGYGGGINTCTSESKSTCIEETYVGAGGGVNAPLVFGDRFGNYDQSGTNGDTSLFLKNLGQSTAVELRDAEQIYLSCGFGGGFGFQTLESNESIESPDVFAQTYGFGGGGHSFALIKKREPLVAEAPALPIERADFVALVKGLSELGASSLNKQKTEFEEAAVDCRGPRSERGLLSQDGALRVSIEDLGYPVGVAFEPYGFPIADCSIATAETAYLPSSTSSSDLFFSQWDRDQALAQLEQADVERVVYTLNLNAANVSLYSDPDEPSPEDCSVAERCIPQAINEEVLGTLQQANVRVSLAIPLFIQHDNTSYTSGTAAIVSDNEEMLDYAVDALRKYAHIDTLIIGTGEKGTRKGFDTRCNGYTYLEPQYSSLCGGYQSELTFEDYYSLLDAIFQRIEGAELTGPITIAVRQSAEGWLNLTSIGLGRGASALSPNCSLSGTCVNDDCTDLCTGVNVEDSPLSLLDYWQSAAGQGPRNGLNHFISDLTIPAGVTIRPMVRLDLVEQAIHREVPGSWLLGGCEPSLADLSCAEQTLTDLLNVLQAEVSEPLPGFGVPVIETGWYGTELAEFVQGAAFSEIWASGFDVFLDELIDQPWQSIPQERTGMPKATCGGVYPVAYLDTSNPPAPPMSSQLPPSCSPNFYDPNLQPGQQAEPDCLCLTNSTNYPATFSPFISNVTKPADSFGPPLKSAPLLTVPPRRVATFSKKRSAKAEVPVSTSDLFYENAVKEKIGSFSLAVTFPRYPLPQVQDSDVEPTPELGALVPDPEPNQRVPSQACVGVSDAQTGAANANNSRPCLELWYQYDLDGDGKPRTRAEVDGAQCVSVSWTAKGTAWDRVRGWELKTLEAPAPTPDSMAKVYRQAPISMVPQETQILAGDRSEVSAAFQYCENESFPTGLSDGQYFIRVQPVGGDALSSVDAIDVEFIDPNGADPIGGPSVTVKATPSHTTNWKKVGKFTVDYPTQAAGASSEQPIYTVKSIAFEYANQDPRTRVTRPKSTFTLYPPIDNGLSDFTLPGADPTPGSGGISDSPDFMTRMTMRFSGPIPELVTDTSDGTVCVVDFQITSGSDAGDQGGKAKLQNAPIAPDRPQDACWLELGSAKTFINGGTFQWQQIPTPNR